MSKVIKQLNLDKLQVKCREYFYKGYNLYFIQGWFCAYLSSINDADEDLLLPSYLVLNEETIKDEKLFLNFVDELVLLYKTLSIDTYEKNKLLKPLLSLEAGFSLDGWLNNKLTKPTVDNNLYLSTLVWLYGYLSNVLSNDNNITEELETKHQELLDTRYYAKLYDLSCVFLLLDKDLDLKAKYKQLLSQEFINDYQELKTDVVAWWEPDTSGNDITQQVSTMSLTQTLPTIIPAINDIFYTMRIIDEERFT